VHAFQCEHIKGQPQALGVADWAWVKPGEFSQYVLPKAAHKLAAIVLEKR